MAQSADQKKERVSILIVVAIMNTSLLPGERRAGSPQNGEPLPGRSLLAENKKSAATQALRRFTVKWESDSLSWSPNRGMLNVILWDCKILRNEQHASLAGEACVTLVNNTC